VSSETEPKAEIKEEIHQQIKSQESETNSSKPEPKNGKKTKLSDKFRNAMLGKIEVPIPKNSTKEIDTAFKTPTVKGNRRKTLTRNKRASINVSDIIAKLPFTVITEVTSDPTSREPVTKTSILKTSIDPYPGSSKLVAFHLDEQVKILTSDIESKHRSTIFTYWGNEEFKNATQNPE